MRDLASRFLRFEVGEMAIGYVDMRDDGTAVFVLEPVDAQLVPARVGRRPVVLLTKMPRAAIEHGLDATPNVARLAAAAILGAQTLVEIVLTEERVALDRDT